jgi:SPFH domain / Band 7 family
MRKMRVDVLPNFVGVVYKNNRLWKIMEPGSYFLSQGLTDSVDIKRILLPTTAQSVSFELKHVITSVSIPLSLIVSVVYKVDDYTKYTEVHDIFRVSEAGIRKPLAHAEELLEIRVRHETLNYLASVSSEQFSNLRGDLETHLSSTLSSFGLAHYMDIIEIKVVSLVVAREARRLLLRTLEHKLTTQFEIESAETAVSSATSIKKAVDIMSSHNPERYQELLNTLRTLTRRSDID